ncbi:hypothetical protein KJ840_05815 [Patescibacteria group bacterium]|nr:hypothetical protein [Patescibacteria group bacterium]
MNKILVLIGRPGAGKSYLTKKFIKNHQNFTPIDVWMYIKPLQTNKGVPEDKILDRYKLMYKEIEGMPSDILLEIGTNYFEYNIKKLYQLSLKKKVYPIFCLLDTAICRQRCINRTKRGEQEHKRRRALEIRFKKIFPDNHKKFADKLGLTYFEMDMLKPLNIRIKYLENLCN